MKNIHVLPTPNPSRLYKDLNNRINITDIEMKSGDKQNIYITNDEDIKEGDWCLDKFNQIWKLENKKLIAFDSQGIKRFSTHNILGHEPKKIILTTDPQLIQDGVQPINDEFLEWFIKNSSCEEVKIVDGYQMFSNKNAVKIYKIIIPKEESKQFVECKCTNALQAENCIRNCGHGEEPKQETFNSKRGLKEVQLKDPNTCEYYKEVGCIKDVCDCYTLVAKQETFEEIFKEAALKYAEEENSSYTNDYYGFINGAIEGVKWQKERSYSEVELLQLLVRAVTEEYDNLNEWFEQFKKK